MHRLLFLAFLLLLIGACKNDVQKTSNEKKVLTKEEKINAAYNQIKKEEKIIFKTNDAKKLNDLALKYVKENNFIEAKKLFLESLKFEQNNPVVYNNLGLIASNEMNIPLANEYFNKAIQIDSSYFNAYINLSSLYVENDYFEKGIKLNALIISKCKEADIVGLAYYLNSYSFLKRSQCEQANLSLLEAKKILLNNQNFKEKIRNMELNIQSCLNFKK